MAEQEQRKSGRFMGWYFGSNLLMRILLGLFLGALVGLFLAFNPGAAAPYIAYTKFFGDVFIRLLRMIVVPVIFFSLITGASSITPHQLGRVGLKTMAYYLITTAVAVSIALIIAGIFSPGAGLGMAGDTAVQGKSAAQTPLAQVLLNIIPMNPMESLAKGDVLPIIFFALVFGIALSILRDADNADVAKYADALFHLCSTIAEVMYKVVAGIMQYAPIGVFVLISVVFAQQGAKVIGPLVFVTLLCYIGFAAHVLLVYGGILRVFGLSFTKFVRGAHEASITAFVTRSSNAALPVSLRVSEENLGVSRSITSFALPVGATVNMDGTAIYLAVCASFIANAVGAPLNFEQQSTLVVVATLASIGTAGVPGAGAIMMLMVLEAVGLPVTTGSPVAAAYAMILGIDALLDMGRTCLNVTGDVAGVAVVAKSEQQLDMSKWR
ncbi:MAG: dicarboxylate/amino acid:cation symporter [Desulfovibrio sp.]|jgi:Na+/H+-dicarboxylate symporter|nr:dicarboxylate/amino acid:cation symporter [Desulfovibrio sp.]